MEEWREGGRENRLSWPGVDSRHYNISTTRTQELPPVYVTLHYTLISIFIMKVHQLGRKEGEGGRGREGGRKKERGNERVVETGRDGLGERGGKDRRERCRERDMERKSIMGEAVTQCVDKHMPVLLTDHRKKSQREKSPCKKPVHILLSEYLHVP